MLQHSLRHAGTGTSCTRLVTGTTPKPGAVQRGTAMGVVVVVVAVVVAVEQTRAQLACAWGHPSNGVFKCRRLRTVALPHPSTRQSLSWTWYLTMAPLAPLTCKWKLDLRRRRCIQCTMPTGLAAVQAGQGQESRSTSTSSWRDLTHAMRCWMQAWTQLMQWEVVALCTTSRRILQHQRHRRSSSCLPYSASSMKSMQRPRKWCVVAQQWHARRGRVAGY